MFCTMNETPTAVINGARRGALRSGLYAIRSMLPLITPNIGIVINKVTASPTMMKMTLDPSSSPSTRVITVLATRPESANTSPWAKLISCRIP